MRLTVSPSGQIIVPLETCRKLGLRAGSQVEVRLNENQTVEIIPLKPVAHRVNHPDNVQAADLTPDQQALRDRLMKIVESGSKIPARDRRSPEEILGYDERGLPT